MAEEKKNEVAQKKPGFFKGVKAEFKKIVWPTKKTIVRETGAVIFFGVLLGLVIALVDAAIKFGLGLIV